MPGAAIFSGQIFRLVQFLPVGQNAPMKTFTPLLPLLCIVACQPEVSTPTPDPTPVPVLDPTPAASATAPTASSPPAAQAIRIADLHAQSSTLAGQSVTVSGEVVKFNANILNRNWVHVRDGSGDETAGTHDLTVTTKETLQVGQKVTLTGVVGLNRDFSAGYKYPLLLEKAVIGTVPVHTEAAKPAAVHSNIQAGAVAPKYAGQLPAGHPPIKKASQPKNEPQRKTFTGTVEEVVHASNKYSYLKMTVNAESMWAAVPYGEFSVGQNVAVRGEFRKESFASPTLNRSFKNVWFGTLLSSKK